MVKIERAAKGQQWFGPGNFEPWTHTPHTTPPQYGQRAPNKSVVELVFVIDRMIDWTRRACGLPHEFWTTTTITGDTAELHKAVLCAVRAVYKKQLCQVAPPAWADCRDDVFYFPEYILSLIHI